MSRRHRLRYTEDNAPLAAHLARLRQCRTTNAFNRVHIDFNRELAPLQVLRLKRETATDRPEPTKEWLRGIRHLSPAVLKAPQGYRPHVLANPGAMLFSDPATPARKKSLLVTFTGVGAQLFLPLGVFLQAFDSARWDVVVVRMHPARVPYRLGIEGMAEDFPGIVRFIATAVRPKRYRGMATLGVSSGGHAAIIAAFGLGAERCVCASGVIPRQSPEEIGEWTKTTGTNPPPAISYVFGADHARDGGLALALQSLFGGTLVPMPGIRSHNVFLPLAGNGQFEPLMQNLLPPAPSPGIAALARRLGAGRRG